MQVPSTYKILLYDADSETRQILTALLERRGFSICEEKELNHLSKQLCQQNYDLVLLGIRFSEWEEYDHSRLLHMVQHESLPLILMTSTYSLKPLDEEYENLSIIKKPFQVKRLLAIIENSL
jgi:DNA-binding NtrC family response regulator